jgi:Ca2+-binding EF-hand superfamily protein
MSLIRKELKISPYDLSDHDIHTLVRWLDDDDSNSVSIAELAAYGTRPADLFKKYDKDKAGTLDGKEFTQLVRKELKLGPGDVTDKDIKALIAALDEDGAGTISIEELAVSI